MKNVKLKVLSKGSKKYIHIYYVYKGVRLIISTGIEYQKSYMKSDLTFKSNKADHQNLNFEISKLLEKTNEYIDYCFKNDLEIVTKQCKEYIFSKERKINNFFLKQDNTDNHIIDQRRYALDYYSEFYELKLSEVKSKYSAKDYKSLYNALRDYQSDNKLITFDMMNDIKFCFSLRDYLRSSREENKSYFSKGNLQDTTINKRFQSFKNWLSWIENKGLYQFKSEVKKFNVKKGIQEINALSKEEIQEIYSYNNYTESEQLIIDVFVMNCYMGLRFSDLYYLSKDNFQLLEDNQLYYVIYNSKTQTKIEVPVLKIVDDILKKYDYQPHVHCNQVFNRKLKDILQKHKLLENVVYINEKRNDKTIRKQVKLNQIISSHFCRKTYITLALHNNVNLSTLMNSTGHTQISTVQKYMKKQRNYNAFKKMM